MVNYSEVEIDSDGLPRWASQVKIEDYSDQLEVINQSNFKASLRGYAEIPLNNICLDPNIQPREENAHPKSYGVLESQIIQQQILKPLVVFYDNNRNKYSVLSGFHRTEALTSFQKREPTQFNELFPQGIPCLVVELPGDLLYLIAPAFNRENRQQSSITEKDIRRTLETAIDTGCFLACKDKSSKKDAMIELLTVPYGVNYLKSIKKIVNAKIKEGATGRAVTRTTQAQIVTMTRSHYGIPLNVQLPNSQFLIGTLTNSRKTFCSQQIEFAADKRKNPNLTKDVCIVQKNSITNIKAALQKRNEELQNWENMNLVNSPTGLTVREVVFYPDLPQDNGQLQVFRWNEETEKFVNPVTKLSVTHKYEASPRKKKDNSPRKKKQAGKAA